MLAGWLVAALVIVVWGMTFASTRVLLVDFSALEILVIRFALALAMMLPVAWWGTTDAGYYALDGSFSVTTDWAANGERFARAGNLAHLVFLGALASATCFALWSAACKRLGMVRTTIGLYLTPVVGVLFAALFLGERLTGMGAIGGGLILFGVMCANWRMKR